jgi:hypothetical protein
VSPSISIDFPKGEACVKHPFLKTFQRIRHVMARKREEKEIAQWEEKGKPAPPPHVVKQRVLKAYAKKYGLRILIETGTFLGTMVQAMKETFDRIYSIELSSELYERARNKFHGVQNIELIHGDSGIELGKIVNSINQPALFWLDSHYSGQGTAKGESDTPIFQELYHLFKSINTGHVVIIDDARFFGTDPAYPSIKELSDFIHSKNPDVDIVVQDDSIRITPRNLRMP